MIHRRVEIVSVLLIVALLLAPYVALGCGPFTLNAIFTFTAHPEYPLEKFARGEIGVVQPSYARSYLFVAYRHLNNAPFTQAEQRALLDLWNDRLNRVWDAGEQEWIASWLAARQKVAGVGEAPKIDIYRNREKPNEYENYINCQKDSFETAVETIEARIKRFGADSAEVKQWVEGQDQVFANCSEGKHIPAPLTDDANPFLRADRQYQIAAANFYAANFEDAKTVFEAIASDANSPWRTVAPYLVARSLLRKGSLGPPETRQEALSAAEAQLNKVLTSAALESTHADAKRLLSLVQLRLHPEQRLHQLGELLATKRENPGLKQDLWDYTVLLDGYEDADSGKSKLPGASRTDDLTDWITAFQSDSPEDVDHAIERWRGTSSLPWLVAALSGVDAKHPQAVDLIKAADQVSPSSPGFASVVFHAVRLDTEAGRVAEARRRIDELMSKSGSAFNVSSINLLRHQRMLAAKTLDEFLTYAQRMPAGMSWDEDGREIPADPEETAGESRPAQNKPLFDVDAAQIFNRLMPLAVLKQAAKNAQLPTHLRRDLVQAVWLRSILLKDYTTADELAPVLKDLLPEMAPLLDNFASQSQPDAKTFLAIYLWLHYPGLEPIVDAGIIRGELGAQDSYRDNWWCAAAFTPSEGAAGGEQASPKKPEASPIFLTAAQRAAASRENAVLSAFGAGPNYIARQVIEWATRNPTDPRVPEALHLAVKSTRYGCADKQTGRWSKAAYDLLHRRYPKSDWTKRTPYWFKN